MGHGLLLVSYLPKGDIFWQDDLMLHLYFQHQDQMDLLIAVEPGVNITFLSFLKIIGKLLMYIMNRGKCFNSLALLFRISP